MIPGLDILEAVSLASRTTLGLGGPARFYLQARDEASVRQGLQWARRRGVRAAILGGGSNLVVSDAGFDGLVIEMAQTGFEVSLDGDEARVTASAGQDWDTLVEATVQRGLAGLECLSGIPGRVGATPIQNVGAYGHEVAETIESVRVLDRESLKVSSMDAASCGFGYRHSRFKEEPEQRVVLAVTFELRRHGAPEIRYAELEGALADDDEAERSLARVREVVIGLRRSKSMVIDFADENHRSAGSFFTNPIVSEETAARVVERAIEAGIVSAAAEVPRWPTEDGRVKLAAGWLIERAGMKKGTRHGNVGISTRHALALVHHGDGTTAQLLELADRVRAAVQERFSVELHREPTAWL